MCVVPGAGRRCDGAALPPVLHWVAAELRSPSRWSRGLKPLVPFWLCSALFLALTNKHRQASIASQSLILMLVESVARAHCDLLDVALLGHTAGFSASLGQEEPEDTLVGQRCQAVLHI